MYGSKFAVAVKSGNQVLREDGDSVYLPFGSTYSLYLKNLNSVRASVKVSIDGQDVTEGMYLVVDPNSDYELSRFIKNGNLKRGNSFKFIERTAAVTAGRGNRLDDGLIRIEFKFEKPQPIPQVWPDEWVKKNTWSPWKDHLLRPSWPEEKITCRFKDGDSIRGTSAASGALNSAYAATTTNTVIHNNNLTTNTVGITAPGAPINQEFSTVSRFEVEDVAHVLVLRLVGKKVGLQGQYVITTTTPSRSKIACSICQHKNKSSSKFCSECGASLELV